MYIGLEVESQTILTYYNLGYKQGLDRESSIIDTRHSPISMKIQPFFWYF